MSVTIQHGNASAGGGFTAASQAEQEAGTGNTTGVTPLVQQYHQSAAKAWCKTTGTTVPAITASYNMTSVTDSGVGVRTFTIATDFSSIEYVIVIGGQFKDNAVLNATISGDTEPTAGAFEMRITSGSTETDPTGGAGVVNGLHFACFGDQ